MSQGVSYAGWQAGGIGSSYNPPSLAHPAGNADVSIVRDSLATEWV